MRWLAGDRGEPRDRLDPIRIFTTELELRGFVASTGQLVTDILLRGEDLAFLPIGAPEVPDRWIRVSPPEILLVAPPPLATRSTWRPTRDRLPLALRIGPYRAGGRAPQGRHRQSRAGRRSGRLRNVRRPGGCGKVSDRLSGGRRSAGSNARRADTPWQ